MRKITIIFLLIILASTTVIGQDEDTQPTTQPSVNKGGIGPCLATCLLGPRVGLEMNEGATIQTSEWIALAGNVVGPSIHSSVSLVTRAYMAYDTGGKQNDFNGALASFFIGPRVGQELHERKIRTKEWLTFCGIGTCLIGWEAYKGKTMTEIEVAEGLRKG